MIKNRIILILTGIIFLLILVTAFFYIEFRNYPLLDANKIQPSQIQKIIIQNGNLSGVSQEITEKDEIKQIYNILKSMTYRKDFDQRSRDGWSFNVKLFYNGKEEDYTFASMYFTSSKTNARYIANKDIVPLLEKMYDWDAIFKEQYKEQRD